MSAGLAPCPTARVPRAAPATGRCEGWVFACWQHLLRETYCRLRFLFGRVLRVFSRVCQPWHPCFHKRPLRKELVVLSRGADTISTGEVSPWRLGCRWAEPQEDKFVLRTWGQLHHKLGGTQRPSWLGGVGNRGCLLQELRPHAPWETTWWETGANPKPSIMGEPKEQVLALGLPASLTASPVPTDHPPPP